MQMTNSEAIKQLKGIRSDYDIDMKRYPELVINDVTALDMAIEALRDTRGKANHVVAEIKVDTDEIMERLEQEWYKPNEWIPCSERLPEFPCLVSDANGNMPYVPTGIVTVESKDKGTWAIDASRIDPVQTLNGRTANLFVYGNRIVAWMPLPDPYKGGDDDDEQ